MSDNDKEPSIDGLKRRSSSDDHRVPSSLTSSLTAERRRHLFSTGHHSEIEQVLFTIGYSNKEKAAKIYFKTTREKKTSKM